MAALTQQVGNPFVGPRTFREDEAGLFFGREREARDLISLIVAKRLVLFYSQSGAGKSSLLNTRIDPGLRAEGFEVLPVGRVREASRLAFQPDNVFVYNLQLSLHQGQEVSARFGALSLADFLDNLVLTDGKYIYDPTYRYPAGENLKPRVLLIDQFEEILTTNPAAWEQRDAFFLQLATALSLDDHLWVVLTMREDFVAALEPFLHHLPGRLGDRYYMRRLNRDAALQAISNPVRKAGRPFVEGAAELLVDNLRRIQLPEDEGGSQLGEYVEPVQLQTVCFQMWESLKSQPGATITEEDVRNHADVDRALAQFYTATITDTAAQTGVAEGDLRSWFEHDLITEAGTRGIIYRGDEMTGRLPTTVADYVSSRFMLRTEVRGGRRWYELVHDRFVQPILAANSEWEDNLRANELERATVRLRRRSLGLALAVSFGLLASLALCTSLVSVQSQRATTAEALQDAQVQRATAAVALQDAQVQRATAAVALRQAQGEATRAAIAVQEAQVERTRVAVVVKESGVSQGAFLADAGLVSGAIPWLNSRDPLTYVPAMSASVAQPQAVEAHYVIFDADSRILGIQALRLASTRPDVAALIALEASRSAITSEARQGLLAAVTANPAFQYILYGNEDTQIADAKVSPTEDMVAAAGSPDGSIVIWNLQSRKVQQTLVGHPTRATAVAWRSGGTQLATGDTAGNVYLWDLAPGAAVSQTLYASAKTTSTLNAVRSLQFSPDGSTLAAGGCYLPAAAGTRNCQDGEVRIWEIPADPAASIVVTDYVDSVAALAFSPDGAWLATGGCDQYDGEEGECTQGSVSLLSRADGWSKVRSLTLLGRSGAVTSLAFDPVNPNVLAAGSADGSLSLWDASTGSMIDAQHETNNKVTSLAYSRDGSLLASAECSSLTFSVANPHCAQAKIQVWSTNAGTLAPYVDFAGHSGWATALSFVRDGHRLISGGDDGNLYVWDTLAWPALAEPVWHSGPSSAAPASVQSAAFSPDSKMLAVGECVYQDAGQAPCTESKITLLDLASNTPRVEIKVPDVGLDKLTFVDWLGVPQLAAAGCKTVDADGNCSSSRIMLWYFDQNWAYHGEQLASTEGTVTALNFTPGGGRLAVGDDSGFVTVWDTTSKQPLFEPARVDSNYINSVSFSADGATLAASGHDNNIVLLDATSGRRLASWPVQLPGSKSSALSLFSPVTSTLMASGGAVNHPVTLWTIAPFGDAVAADAVRLSDRIIPITGLSFSGDGSLLASADMAPEFTLWDVAERRAMGPLSTDNPALQRLGFNTVYDIDMRPDGKQLATVVADSGKNTWVLLWDTDPASWAQRACLRANRHALTATERLEYLGTDAEDFRACQ